MGSAGAQSSLAPRAKRASSYTSSKIVPRHAVSSSQPVVAASPLEDEVSAGGEGAGGGATTTKDQHDPTAPVLVKVAVVEEKFQGAFLIDMDKTLLGGVCGNDERSKRWIRTMKRRRIHKICYTAWLLSSLAGLFVMTNVVSNPRAQMLLGLGGLPFCFLKLVTSQRQLFAMVIFSFEGLYLTFLALVLSLLWADLISYDTRVFAVLEYVMSFCNMLTGDAATNGRHHAQRGVGMFFIFVPVMMILISHGVIPVSARTIRIKVANLDAEVDTVEVFLQTGLILMLYIARSCYTLFRDRSCLMFIRPRIFLKRMPRGSFVAPDKVKRICSLDDLNTTRVSTEDVPHILEKEPQRNVFVMRVKPERFLGQEIDSRETLARAVAGDRVADWIFWFARQKITMVVLFVSWTLGIILGTFAWTPWIPKEASLLSWIAWLSLLIPVGLFNCKVFKRCCMSFDVFVLSTYTFLWVFGMGRYFSFDIRTASIAFLALTFCIAFVFDAVHSRFSKRTVLVMIEMGTAYIFGLWMLQLGDGFAITENTKIRYSFFGRELEADAVTFANTRLSVVFSFLLKNIYIMLQKPGAFVMLRSTLSVQRLTLGKLFEEMGLNNHNAE